MNNDDGRAKGGRARAASMTSEERSELARKAAAARWSGPEPQRTISGSEDRPLRIGSVEIECYVLEDGSRVITQAAMMTALGRNRRVSKKPGEDESLPTILRAQALREFITDDFIDEARPIWFIKPEGARAYGYRAEVLPQLCEAWLEARSAGRLASSQTHIANAAEKIVRGLARVGIIALIDEATGYQDERARDALAKILEAYVTKELRPWVKTFDAEFYKEMFRLRGLPFDPYSMKKPAYFGHLTNNVVYKRLAPGIFSEIKAQREKDATKRRAKMHQQLTSEVGHPKLREHIASVTTIMKLSDTWEDFEVKLNRVHPMIDPSLPEPLWTDEVPAS